MIVVTDDRNADPDGAQSVAGAASIWVCSS
jgi:hypothetical protein